MYQINRNNYHLKPKNSNIQTPKEVSEFIFNLLTPYFPKSGRTIFDPCCGQRNLLEPWRKADYWTEGIDIDPKAEGLKIDFLTMKKEIIIFKSKDLESLNDLATELHEMLVANHEDYFNLKEAGKLITRLCLEIEKKLKPSERTITEHNKNKVYQWSQKDQIYKTIERNIKPYDK